MKPHILITLIALGFGPFLLFVASCIANALARRQWRRLRSTAAPLSPSPGGEGRDEGGLPVSRRADPFPVERRLRASLRAHFRNTKTSNP